MREIEFRGKPEKHIKGFGEWVHGHFRWCYPNDYSPEITQWIENESYYATIPVIKETVGQFTGLLDIKKTEIYDGDIVKVRWGDNEITSYIKFENGGFGFVFKDEVVVPHWEMEVIGNIHDNPELLEVGDD